MTSMLLLVLIFCVSTTNVLSTRPISAQCPPNEERVPCINRCDKCEDRYGGCSQIPKCIHGCNCVKGFYRNKDGNCIPEALCDGSMDPDDKSTEKHKFPVPTQCGKDEEYRICDCEKNCCNYNNPKACEKECHTGCFCRQGLVRDKQGNCIRPEKCPPGEKPKTCGPNEVYSDCVNPCNDCTTRGNCQFLVCNKGCDCRKGYRRYLGICIPESQCPPSEVIENCGPNEVYTDCVNPCNNCNLRKRNCSFVVCYKGCDCRPGYTRSKNVCIPVDQCPPVTCGPNSKPSRCASRCPPTCRNPVRICPQVCTEGCVCNPGYILDDFGNCIPKSQCPNTDICGPNSTPTDCLSCERTCRNPKPEVCTESCTKGCECDPGYIKDDNDNCIPEDQCPVVCGPNSTPSDCVFCEPTCRNPKPEVCAQSCAKGCACDPGYIKDDNGNCIPQDQCPVNCGPNSKYSECGSACPRTCNDRDPKICSAVCVRGCFCNRGFIFDSRRNCIKESQCPRNGTVCKKIGEEYKSCGSLCEATCVSIRSRRLIKCPIKCKPGCFCKDGLVRDLTTGNCVQASECGNNGFCPKFGEVYKSCGSPCEATCANLRFHILIKCPQKCKAGCFCNDGLVRDSNNNCVEPDQCPYSPQCSIPKCGYGCQIDYEAKPCPACKCDGDVPGPQCSIPQCGYGCQIDYNAKPCPACKCGGDGPEKCGKDEVYYTNKPDCKNTCENYDNPAVLCLIGEPGCFCKEGFVKRKDGKCVRPEDCFSPTDEPCPQVLCTADCPLNSNAKPCPKCECKKDKPCPQIRCRSDCPLNSNAKPCPRCECKTERPCPQIRCRPECPLNSNAKPCPRCECKTEICGANEVYSDCVNPCNDCTTRGKCQFLVCNKGCDCRKGYRRYLGICIPESLCPPREGNCGKNEEYLECGSACPPMCDNKNPSFCPAHCKTGCFCKDGYIREKEGGKCIRESECPKGNCGKNEEYLECGSACPPMCDNKNPSFCPQHCKTGCFCKDGYIREKDGGKCIRESECPKDTCGKNEEYSECGTACQPNCFNMNPICTLQCVTGCFCKKGYIREFDGGKCIQKKKCPLGPIVCPYPLCKVGCKVVQPPNNPCPTCVCENNSTGSICNLPLCKVGCQIVHVPNEPCPKCVCDKNTTGPVICHLPLCKKDCKLVQVPNEPCPECVCDDDDNNNNNNNTTHPAICHLPLCREGCKLVKVPNQPCPKCVCDNTTNTCGGNNEEYSSCGTACPRTCDNKNPICTEQCKAGCFCKKDFIREKEGGRCILETLCPRKCLQPKCARGCPLDTKHKPCPRCVCPKDCPVYDCAERCYLDEKHKPCPRCVCPEDCPMLDCAERCYIDEKHKPCPRCVCPEDQPHRGSYEVTEYEGQYEDDFEYYFEDDYGENDDDTMNDLPEQPDDDDDDDDDGQDDDHEGKCGPDEQKYECTPFCTNRCNPIKACPKICKRGCFCKKGLVLNDDGKCVKKSECNQKPPDDKKCKKNEQYYPCKPTCNNTCENYGKNTPCPLICRSGCFCKEGMVLRKDGECVKPEQCKSGPVCFIPLCKEGCKIVQVPNQPCPKCVCDNDTTGPVCFIPLCKEGCKIVQVPNQPCPKCVCDNDTTETCGPDEEYYQCKPFCTNRCNPPKICPHICIKGCFCKKGLVLNDNNKCVKKSQCNQKPPNDKKCKKNEQYYTCKPTCNNTCENYGRKGPCPLYCTKGCYCKRGLVLRKDGQCVKPEQCKNDTCGPDEEYYECTPFCSNRCNPLKVCPKICIKGCFCKKGLVINDDNKCVKKSECNQKPPGDKKCKKNEQYYGCKPTCNNTCENYGKNWACPDYCISGCDCKKGLVLRKDGECVEPKKCQNGCGKNEIIVNCAKPKWCNTCEIRGNCKLITCFKGCDCKPGFYRNKDGVCMPQSQCPSNDSPGDHDDDDNDDDDDYYYYDDDEGDDDNNDDDGHDDDEGDNEENDFPGDDDNDDDDDDDGGDKECGKNEKIVDCAKPKWCNTCGIRGNCKLTSCSKGCDCKPGFYRNEDSVCIPQSQCPGNDSPGGDDDDDNHNGKDGLPCPLIRCAKDCITVKDENSCPTCKCEISPIEDCPINEQHSDCVNPCNSCASKNATCNFLVCNKGCDCKPGYTRNEQQICIPEDLCPPSKTCPQIRCKAECPLNENAKPCPRCECKKDCPKPKCLAGCYLDRENKPCPKCVCPKECPKFKCSKNCYLDRNHKPCPRCVCPKDCPKPKCLAGCYLDRKHKPCPKCVCPKDRCKKNEELKECGTVCPPTCSNRNPFCTKQCKRGCFCKKGYIREKEGGKCIPESKCPKECPVIDCIEGCYLDNDHKPCPRCVCPEDQCPKNEEWLECGTSCPPTCGGNKNQLCTTDCKRGCFCKKGYIREKKGGKCIPESKCPKDKCQKHEERQECGTACPPTCANRNPICTKQCKTGCFCKTGYIREKEGGKCIRESKCPKDTCGKHEKYSDCGTACQSTCDNRNPRCTKQCAQGCFCKKGFIRKTEGGKCIPEDECPKKDTCPQIRCTADCPLNSNAKPCPRCECKKVPVCPRIACPSYCHFDTSKPCPKCVCDSTSKNIHGYDSVEVEGNEESYSFEEDSETEEKDDIDQDDSDAADENQDDMDTDFEFEEENDTKTSS